MCAAVCSIRLQCVALWDLINTDDTKCVAKWCSVLQCAAVCCVVVCCSVLQCGISSIGRSIPSSTVGTHQMCIVLQCVAVCCSVLQFIAVGCSEGHHQWADRHPVWRWAPTSVCFSVLRCGTSSIRSTAPCSTLGTHTMCIVLQCVAVCCSVLQCVAVCCSVLHCVAKGPHQ